VENLVTRMDEFHKTRYSVTTGSCNLTAVEDASKDQIVKLLIFLPNNTSTADLMRLRRMIMPA
jgi:hypothetical protein